jgi:2-polyprenyl-3-methyl-5-hydroxy-6-metoxy-1,4-benzoquinol methylase
VGFVVRYTAHTPSGAVEFWVPDGSLSAPERDALAVEIARRDYGEAVVSLGGKEGPMPTLAEIRKSGRMPTAEEYADFYERQANPRPHDGWFASNQHIDRGFARTRFALEHIRPGDSVLEVGTQSGGMTRHLIEAVEGGHVTGIDVAPTYIQRTRESLGGLKAELIVADACAFNTRRRYNVIVCMEVMEHVPDPRQLLRNLWRLLKKDGVILVTVPDETVPDTEGEHLHHLDAGAVVQIIGEATGIRPAVWHEHVWYYALVEKDGTPYES